MIVVLFKGRGVMSRLIEWQTNGDYSHAALLDEDNNTLYESWQTAGVRKKINWSVSDDPTVDFFKFAHTKAEADAIRSFAESQLGKKYDWLGVVRFVSRTQLRPDAKEKWFCSEFVTAALAAAGIDLFKNTEPNEVPPDLIKRSVVLSKYPSALI